MNKRERIGAFTDAVWEWYARHKRELPWRDMAIADDTERAYRVLVSEIMLQQTQVSRVKIVFRNFLENFPTLRHLARASNAEVILAWRGMGYNSRALRLRDAAKAIVNTHGGEFPREYDRLIALKGLGPYTASAIRNFAFNLPTPCIDTNIRRILHRTFYGPENPDGTWQVGDRRLLELAEEVLEVALAEKKHEIRSTKSETVSPFGIGDSDFRRTAAEWHAALMDFGSLVQTKNNPKWDLCPLTANGLMKTTPQAFARMTKQRSQLTARSSKLQKEPGRFEGAKYVPNRIFRGRIVEALRDAPEGLGADEIGPLICMDWATEHEAWLHTLLQVLIRDGLLAAKERRYRLSEG